MLRALYSGSSGMLSQQMNMDILSNNLANVNTTGFKKSRADFSDLLYSTMREKNTVTRRGETLPYGTQTGNGTRISSTKTVFTDGNLQATGNSLDIAIEGDGFLQVQMPDGTIAYTRNGALQKDGQGNLVTQDGNFVQPAISIPQGTQEITIAPDGTISATIAGNSTPQKLGQIQMAKFINPAGLEKVGSSLYKATENSGPVQVGFAGGAGFGNIKQGNLEMSNVNVAEEMINVMVAQRAYELNSRTIRNADDMLGMANSLIRR